MGNCNGGAPPDTSNFCSDYVGQGHSVPNFCITSGTPVSDIDTFCRNEYGGPGEWVGTGIATVRCNCGSISDAFEATCQRAAFTAEPGPCCLRDYNCTRVT